MRNLTLRAVALVLMLGMALSASPAKAQLLLDQAIGGSISGGAAMGGIAKQMPTDVIMSKLQAQGFTDISALTVGTTDQALHGTAIDPTGHSVSLIIEPMTGTVLSALPN